MSTVCLLFACVAACHPLLYSSAFTRNYNSIVSVTVICRVGIVPSSVEVRFENLHIQAKVFVGARALPSVLNSYRNFFEVSMAVS